MRDVVRLLPKPLRYALARVDRLAGRPWMVDPTIAQGLVSLSIAEIVGNHPHHIELRLTALGSEVLAALRAGGVE